MIVESIMRVVLNLFSFLTTPIDIPSLPGQAMDYISSAFNYMGAGGGILTNYTHLNYIMVLFGVTLAVDVGIGAYKLVMWIIRKIPIASE